MDMTKGVGARVKGKGDGAKAVHHRNSHKVQAGKGADCNACQERGGVTCPGCLGKELWVMQRVCIGETGR